MQPPKAAEVMAYTYHYLYGLDVSITPVILPYTGRLAAPIGIFPLY